MGRAAPSAARRRAPRRHRLGPRRRRDLGAARHRRADALRVLGRELEAAARRSQHADDAAEALHPARARHAAQEQHPLPSRSAAPRSCRPTCRTSSNSASARPPPTPACCSTSRSTTAAAPKSSMRRAARSPPACRPDDLDERRFGDFLYTAGQPDPDLLIRTSGEMRVSNFLLWQIAYAEIWVTETLVARFPPPRSARSDRRLPEARSPLRRHQAVARRARRQVTRRPQRRRSAACSPIAIVWFAPPVAVPGCRRRTCCWSSAAVEFAATGARQRVGASPWSCSSTGGRRVAPRCRLRRLVVRRRWSCVRLDVVLMAALVALGAVGAARHWTRRTATRSRSWPRRCFRALYLGLADRRDDRDSREPRRARRSSC